MVVLDSAICNKKIRPIFVEWVKEFNHKFQERFFPGYNSLPMSLTLFEWNAMRDIKYDRQRILICDKQLSVFRKLSEGQKKRLNEFSTLLDAIVIKSCSVDNTPALCELIQMFTAINYVYIANCTEINKIVELLSERFDGIEDCIMKQSNNLNDSAMRSFGRQCTNVMSLDISDCVMVTDISFYTIMIHCKMLFHLNIKGCTGISARAISVWPLQVHRRRNCRIDFDGYTDVLTRLYIHYYTSSPYSWDLSCCVPHSIVDRTLETMAKYNPDVYDLNIQYSTGITDQSLVLAVELMKNLSRINIKGLPHLTDASLYAMGQHCRKMRDISVGAQLRVTEWGWSALAQCKNLVRLTLVKVYLGMALRTILCSCDQLKHLLMGDIMGLTDGVMAECAPYMTGIEKWSVVNCKDFGDNGLIAISKYLYSLMVFNVYDCPAVTDAGIIALVKGSPQLSIIGFQDLKLTKWLIRACDKIVVMTIWRNNTGKSYLNKGEIIMKRCKKLKMLQIQHVTDSELAKLNEESKEMRPGLTITNELS